jgi:hypothetical protein
MIAIASQSIECEFVTHRDQQIFAAATEALASSKYLPLHKLHCRVFDGVVEISGTVGSFYLKQLAQAAVLQLNGASVVRNLVEVSGEPAALVATTCGETS